MQQDSNVKKLKDKYLINRIRFKMKILDKMIKIVKVILINQIKIYLMDQ